MRPHESLHGTRFCVARPAMPRDHELQGRCQRSEARPSNAMMPCYGHPFRAMGIQTYWVHISICSHYCIICVYIYIIIFTYHYKLLVMDWWPCPHMDVLSIHIHLLTMAHMMQYSRYLEYLGISWNYLEASGNTNHNWLILEAMAVISG